MTTPYLGQITLFGGNFAISGWAFCNGQLMSIAQNTALYSLLGTTYGGDGVSTFALPNLQSRVAVGQGTGAGLSPYLIGQVGGTENVTLTSAQMPGHSHGFTASGTTAVSGGQSPSANVIPGVPSVTTGFLYVINNGSQPPPTPLTLVGPSCGQAGSNQPHTNLMPTLCVTYIIALQGIYPTRN